MTEADQVKILELMLLESNAGNVAEVERLKALLQGGGVNQTVQPQAVPVDQTAQALPVDQTTQPLAYDDVPSVPTQETDVPSLPASMDTQPTAPSPEVNPADNLANQTTNNRDWLGKITDALWPGSEGMSVGDYVSTAGGRYKDPLEAMKQAEIYPGLGGEGTIPDIMQQRFDEDQGKFVAKHELPTLQEWGNIVKSPEFLSNVGTISGPMLYAKFKKDLAFFKGAPPRIKDVALMTLLGSVATMFGGTVSDMLNQTPSKMGKFDFSTVGKTMLPDLTTQAGRVQQGALWTAVPEAAFSGLGTYVGGPLARWVLGLKNQWMGNVQREMAAAADLSMPTERNIQAMAEWEALGDKPLGWLRQGLPPGLGGPARIETGPYGREVAGEIGTEPYVASSNIVAKAIAAFGAFPGAGAGVRRQAVYHSGTAIENMRRKLDLLGKDFEEDALGKIVTYGAKKWGQRQVREVGRLYDDVDKLALATPGGTSYVPTGRMQQATQDLYDDLVKNFPKDRLTGEPIGLYPNFRADAETWITEIAKLGPTATLAEVRGLRSMVSEDLSKLMQGEYAGLTKKALKKYKDSMTDAIHVDAVAALKKQGVPEADAVANALQLANTTYKLFKDYTRSIAGQQFTKIRPDFWKKSALEGKLVAAGSVEADQMFNLAFNTGQMSPQYMRNLQEILGPKVFDVAARNYLAKAMDRAFRAGELAPTHGMIQTAMSPGYSMGMSEQMKQPAKFNEQIFRQEMGMGGGPFKEKGTGAMRELLRLTGDKVTVRNVESLMTVLSRYPVNMDLATMAARRIPLAGTKGALTVVTGGMLRGASATGGIAASGAIMGTVGGAIATMVLLNQVGRLLSNPNALKALVRFGNTMSSAERAGRTVGKHTQRAMWVKLFADLGFDKEDSNTSFDNVWNDTVGGGVQAYSDLKTELDYRLMQGRQMLPGQ